MAAELSALKAEILGRLNEEGFATFYSESDLSGQENVIYWDVDRYPDVGQFLVTAKRVSASLIVFYERTFSQIAIDDTLERLEGGERSREEKRNLEARLKELQKFEGFTCELGLSFTHGRFVYHYLVRTEWFEEFESIFADVAVSEAALYEEEEDEGPISGYFSRN